MALALLSVGLGIAARAAAGSQRVSQLVGQPAPSFALPAEAHGHVQPGIVSLDAGRGHPQLLVFFYTLCTHCLGELATTHDVTQHVAQDPAHAGDLRVAYIDSPAENPMIPDAYVTRVGIDAPVLLDHDAQVAGRYGIAFYPTLVLLDGSGVVRATWTGEPSAATLEGAIDSLASAATR